MPIDIADEVETLALHHERLQRTHRHPRPQIGAADADIDDIGDLRPGAHRLRKRQELRTDRIHLVPDRLKVGRQPSGRRRTQQPVHHLPLFGRVDGTPAEHGIAQGTNLLLLRQAQQGLHHAFIQMGFGKIHMQQEAAVCIVQCLAEALNAPCILRKGAAQVEGGGVEQAIPAWLMVIDREATRQLAQRLPCRCINGQSGVVCILVHHEGREPIRPPPASVVRACLHRQQTPGCPRPAFQSPWRPRSAHSGSWPRRSGWPASALRLPWPD